ncbi:hypothetical protein LCGC14_0754170 [marine sediment metagenome]|uniref:Uncharacterized protein n=1 Tax=marine sediment metagenome TaxID=412755 RepID=A0A0F9QMW9_9ZZZZ
MVVYSIGTCCAALFCIMGVSHPGFFTLPEGPRPFGALEPEPGGTGSGVTGGRQRHGAGTPLGRRRPAVLFVWPGVGPDLFAIFARTLACEGLVEGLPPAFAFLRSPEFPRAEMPRARVSRPERPRRVYDVIC